MISQAAFDEVVRENMTELDMNVDEAIEDAVQQFEAQVRLRAISDEMCSLFCERRIITSTARQFGQHRQGHGTGL